MAKDVLSLAWEDMRRKNFATAIKRLESRSEIYEDNFEYYLALGIACLYVGDVGAASSYFQMARRIKLTDTRLLLGQAAIFLRRGDTARALEYYLEIKSNDPGNKTADQAMEFIRLHGDYDTICRWVDTGRIEQFYPPINFYTKKAYWIIIPVLACLIGVATTFLVIRHNEKTITTERMDLSNLELTYEERNDAKERDLSGQTFKYILSNKEITKGYNDALMYFQNHRDNAAQVEVNTILNSDASPAIKEKASMLSEYFEVPTFDSIDDVPTYSDVMTERELYKNCWVDWGGKVSNAMTYENGSYSCDLLVGDEKLEHFEGTVKIYFENTPLIDTSRYVRVLGMLSFENDMFYLKGKAVYQSVYEDE